MLTTVLNHQLDLMWLISACVLVAMHLFFFNVKPSVITLPTILVTCWQLFMLADGTPELVLHKPALINFDVVHMSMTMGTSLGLFILYIVCGG